MTLAFTVCDLQFTNFIDGHPWCCAFQTLGSDTALRSTKPSTTAGGGCQRYIFPWQVRSKWLPVNNSTEFRQVISILRRRLMSKAQLILILGWSAPQCSFLSCRISRSSSDLHLPTVLHSCSFLFQSSSQDTHDKTAELYFLFTLTPLLQRSSTKMQSSPA